MTAKPTPLAADTEYLGDIVIQRELVRMANTLRHSDGHIARLLAREHALAACRVAYQHLDASPSVYANALDLISAAGVGSDE